MSKPQAIRTNRSGVCKNSCRRWTLQIGLIWVNTKIRKWFEHGSCFLSIYFKTERSPGVARQQTQYQHPPCIWCMWFVSNTDLIIELFYTITSVHKYRKSIKSTTYTRISLIQTYDVASTNNLLSVYARRREETGDLDQIWFQNIF